MKWLSRRTLLTTFFGLPFFAGAAVPTRHAAAARPPRFDKHAERTISAIINRMLPGDGLPGAVALGIDRRIPAMAEVRPRQQLAELRRVFAEGVAWLDARARASGARDFLDLNEARQEAVLLGAVTSNVEDAAFFVGTLRDRAFALYYTDPLIVAAFAYAGPPQPAGFPDFQEAPR
jgi:Gluconate 2-dehydrogenase subunit 3